MVTWCAGGTIVSAATCQTAGSPGWKWCENDAKIMGLQEMSDIRVTRDVLSKSLKLLYIFWCMMSDKVLPVWQLHTSSRAVEKKKKKKIINHNNTIYTS